jgi:uncharacterized membrane protein
MTKTQPKTSRGQKPKQSSKPKLVSPVRIAKQSPKVVVPKETWRSKKKQALVALAALVACNIAMLMPGALPSGLAGALYLFVLPGWFIGLALRWKFGHFWDALVHVVGTSIAFVMLGGWLINGLGIVSSYGLPLRYDSVLFGFNCVLAAIVGVMLLGKHRYSKKLYSHQATHAKRWWALHAVPLLLPFLAAGGATTVNNGGGVWLVSALVVTIVALAIAMIGFARRIPESLMIVTLFGMGLALLFMTSLRGWHITGYDINQEFQVFQLTRVPFLWSMDHLRDPYNACLSITILPTIAAQFTHIADEYIFKFLFQVLFALLPVIIFLMARRWTNRSIAFLASFFFVSQVWFFQGMPTLIRQEFGLLFFSLLLMTLFNTRLPRLMRNTLLAIYAVAMVTSHYSTSYIALALLIFVYIFNFAASRQFLVRRYKRVTGVFFTHVIRWQFLVFLLGVICVWNGLVTHTGGALVAFVDSSGSNINKLVSGSTLTNGFEQLLYPYPRDVNFQDVSRSSASEFRDGYPQFDYYAEEQQKAGTLEPATFQEAPPRLGSTFQSISSLAFKFIKMLVNNVFIVVGVVYFWFAWRRKWFGSSEYVWLGMSGFVLLAMLLVIPDALKEYNLERLYFQLLLVWGLVGVFGGLLLLSFIKRNHLKYLCVVAVYGVQLLFYSGFMLYWGGGPALIAFNNYGEDYDKFYTHDAEVRAAQWLSQNYHSNDFVFTNAPGRNKLWAYSTVDRQHIMNTTWPGSIGKDNFVYETYINTMSGKAIYTYMGDEYAYTFPHDFLDETKDKLYSSGISQVYK